jgi:hypothetical protein
MSDNQSQVAVAPVQTSEAGLKTTLIGRTKVHWDDSRMRSAYSNVCNVATTREEIMLLFGTSRAWSQVTDELTVDLSDRIILNPIAAKRLLTMLAKTVEEYERAYGSLG